MPECCNIRVNIPILNAVAPRSQEPPASSVLLLLLIAYKCNTQMVYIYWSSRCLESSPQTYVIQLRVVYDPDYALNFGILMQRGRKVEAQLLLLLATAPQRRPPRCISELQQQYFSGFLHLCGLVGRSKS